MTAGQAARAPRLLLATRLADELPDVSGMRERLGSRCPPTALLPRLEGPY